MINNFGSLYIFLQCANGGINKNIIIVQYIRYFIYVTFCLKIAVYIRIETLSIKKINI